MLSSVVTLLVLDRLKAPGWIVGALGVVFGILWIGTFVLFWQQVQTEIFPDDTGEK